MSAGAARIASRTEALVLRRVEYGEADLVLTLFTRAQGRVSALARGARKSRRRFAGALEPFFTIAIELTERPSAELASLVHAEIVRSRVALLSDLSRMELAGRALSWIRMAAPPRTPEPVVFERIERLLDRLSDVARPFPELELGEAGLALLASFGWALEFDRCVRCGKPCPPGKAASIDVPRGGLLCRSCGGGRIRIEGDQRLRFAQAAAGKSGVLRENDITLALNLIDRVFSAHAGIDSDS